MDNNDHLARVPLALRIIRFPLTLIVIGVVLWVGVAFAATGFGRIVGPGHFDPALLIVSVVAAGLFIGGYWVLRHWIEGVPAADLSLPGAGRELAAGLAGGAALFALVAAIAAAAGVYRIAGMNSWQTVWPLLAMAITSGVSEEILLRGIVFRLTERMTGTWLALAISAAIFGAGHIFNPNATWVAAVAIAIEAGILLGAVYMLTRRLWAAIGLHAGWNFTQGWVFGVPVSGVKEAGLVDGRLSGPAWLSGGAFGLEASVIGLVIATAAGLAILRVAARRGEVKRPMWSRPSLSQEAVRVDIDSDAHL